MHARELNLPQAAVLVGMLKATHAYNPRLFQKIRTAARNVVLGQMRKYDKLTDAEADSMQALPLELKYNRITHHSGLAPYLPRIHSTDSYGWCKTHQREDGQPYNLYTDGLKVYDHRLACSTQKRPCAPKWPPFKNNLLRTGAENPSHGHRTQRC